MQAVINTSDLVPHANQGEDSYVIKIEMIDGSSQLVHLSLEQALALGLQCPTTDASKPSSVKKNSTLLNYKIVQPADLNLCPIDTNVCQTVKTIPAPLPRGRPKKRPIAEVQTNDTTETQQVIEKSVKSPKAKEAKIIKTSRTRSGRITRPPIHMERDFEKIVTETKAKLNMTKDIDTVKFEPLKTSESQEPSNSSDAPVFISLETNPKKRFIPAQYRCTTCKKAYLGRNRMARHLKKHPDHGMVNPLNMEDSETWSCLIETALKANKGHRGMKFCKEIVNLIRNARILVKYFFKPAKDINKADYEVDALLSAILNIDEGQYRFNENELCKDVSIFSFLFFNDDAFPDLPPPHSSTPLHSDTENKFPFGPNETAPDSSDNNKNKPVIDLHFGSDMDDVIHLKTNEKTSEDQSDLFVNQTAIADKQEQPHLKNDFMNMFNEDFINKSEKRKTDGDTWCTTKDKSYDLFSNNLFIGSKCASNSSDGGDMKKTYERTNNERHGKEVDIYRNTINNILNFGASDENMSTLLDKEKKTTRKSDEFDLNKLHLDELILADAPVSNMLDTSTGSDDIMNVDQFVNERFKKLTEPEGVNLDLPGMFQFP